MLRALKGVVFVFALVGVVATVKELRGQPAAPLASGTFTHVGIVVPNIDAAMKTFATVYGVTPPATIRVYDNNGRGMPFPPGIVGNKAARAKIVQFPIGDVRVELIEPVDGPTAWSEQLAKFGPSVHHLAFRVADVNDTVRGLEALGGKWVLGEGGQNFAYVDMKALLGYTVEVGRQPQAPPTTAPAQ